ncbi:putative disease resistance protein RGA1 [Pistacia vera]|uniref:putative disease resistance protein RGA1 n=1 Tax=Pistacia vera TaxID=55513 RepID=UPI0012630306|nr:putative disease resistance protein RGA1 [Pistacia vera]
MAEAIVSFALDQLASILSQQIGKQVNLVGDVDEQVDKLTHSLRAIRAVLFEEEQKQMKDEAVRVWLDRLKDVCYDVEDVLDEWNTAIIKLQFEGGHDSHNALAPQKKVRSFFPFPCFGFKEVVLRCDIATKINEINEKLDAVATQKDMYSLNKIQVVEKPHYKQVDTTSIIDVSNICGRDDEKNYLVNKLFCESSEQGLQIISLVGMGGIGKTTLAQLAYNDNEVINNFNKRIWVCVSDPFDEFRVAKAILEALEGTHSNLAEFNSLIEKIYESIKDKKFLLVLDDVWTEDDRKWELFYNCLKNGLPGSRIIITTRKESIALMINSNIIKVEQLSDKENWLLFERIAFRGRSPQECEKLIEVGKEIVRKCKGLPLATKTIGSLLRFKNTREEWQYILGSEMWKLQKIEKGLLSPLMLSYNDLPPMVKWCFLYCSVFPKDHMIESDELINLWMAQGYLELAKDDEERKITGKEYFEFLVTRSLLQEHENTNKVKSLFGQEHENTKIVKMHDIVHDFVQFFSNNECFGVEVHGVEDPFTNSSHVQVRHLKLILDGVASLPVSIFRFKKLRSLLISDKYIYGGNYLTSDDLSRLFDEFTCLRALQLSVESRVEVLPKEIGKLIHLRYLKLSKLSIKILPEWLCELYNLHTLDICGCEVEVLPQGMEKLVNLRYLILDIFDFSLLYMPKGIEKLTGLRRLDEFVISGGGDHDNKACSLDGLKNLSHLKGRLTVRGLGNLTNVREGEMTEVFNNKKNLSKLILRFDKREAGERSGEDDELVLKASQPPPNLNDLVIQGYRGNSFPSSWMTLAKLEVLRPRGCSNIKHLHNLGKSPSLELLCIDGMKNLKKVNNEFWGIESEMTSLSSSSVLFPRLKTLEFWDMKNWEEWDCENINMGMEFMPCLATLSINLSPKLKALPHSLLSTLKDLVIDECPILTERYNKGTGEDWLKISHIPTIKFDGQYVQREQ